MYIIWNPFKVQLNAAIPAKTLFIKNFQKGRDFRDFSISCNAETAKKSPGVISFGGGSLNSCQLETRHFRF